MNGSRLLAAVLVCLVPTVAAGQADDPDLAAALADGDDDHERHAQEAVNEIPSRVLRDLNARGDRQIDASLAVHARAFLVALQRGNIDALTLLSRVPFHFEGEVATTDEAVKQGWRSALQGKNLESTRLFDIDLLSPEEMTAKYGRPPERLASWPLKGAMIAVANLDGHPVVVLWKRSGQGWQALAFHD